MEETVEQVMVPDESSEPAAPVVTPEPPELVYEYQPTDENGRVLGGKQVIKYRTQEELIHKLQDQNIHLVRKLREETRKNRLGISQDEIIPESAPKFDNTLELVTRELSPDEKASLSRDLLDPEKFGEATERLFEASLGAKPERIKDSFNQLSATVQKLRAKIESDAFMASNPDYYPCAENFQAITGWMLKNDLAPVKENFQLAFDTLKKLPSPGGVPVILGKPMDNPVQEFVPEPAHTPEAPASEPAAPPAPKKAPPATGLRDGGTNVVPQKRFRMTLADVNKMSGEEYKKKLLGDPSFGPMVEALEREAAEKNRR